MRWFSKIFGRKKEEAKPAPLRPESRFLPTVPEVDRLMRERLLAQAAAKMAASALPRQKQWPSTYVPRPTEGGMASNAVFDPAMKQYNNAFRNGEPQFEDEGKGQRWRLARRKAMEHALSLVTQAELGQHLVLRGSVVLRAWFEAAAREPGDLDFVVIPAKLEMKSKIGKALIEGIGDLVRLHPQVANDIRFLPEQTRTDDIWTYERAPGRRIVFQWTADGLPPGEVQMDFVFEEAMPDAPVETLFVLANGEACKVQTASKELSLAWKLLWLESDSYPQGKDLYDAVLLAENVTIPRELVRQVLGSARGLGWDSADGGRLRLNWDVEWKDFVEEYPWIEGDAESWKARLKKALGPELT